MKVAVMQPYFFPYIGYFQLIRAVDVFCPYDRIAFQKRGWAHHNHILSPGRPPNRIGLRVRGKSSFRLIADLQLDDSTPWRRQLLKTLRCSYGRRPFFDESYPFLEELMLTGLSSLSEFNKHCIIRTAQHLGLKTAVLSETRFDDLEASLDRGADAVTEDMGHSGVHPPDCKTVRAAGICKRLGGTEFVNSRGGMKLYNKQDFAHEGISLLFLVPRQISYSQGSQTFHPDLSIIDVLMNCGRARTRELLDRYDLV